MKKIMLLTLLLSGCGEIYTHEMASIIEQCDGAENVHTMWIDAHLVRARCFNGDAVSTGKN